MTNTTKNIEDFKRLFNEYVKEVKRYVSVPWYLRIFYKRPGKMPEWETFKSDKDGNIEMWRKYG